MFSLKFILRVLEILILVIVSGSLLCLIYYVGMRTFRYVISFIKTESQNQASWLYSLLPKPKPKK